jgi:hypothetical protein
LEQSSLRKYRELLILPENGIAEVGAENVVAVLDLIDDGEVCGLEG